MDMARRSFLRGRPGSRSAPLRPPWALPETGFTSLCTRCGECAVACPTGLLTGAPGNFPVADFSAGFCDFCGLCADACQPHALQKGEAPPWNLVVAIAGSCLAEQDVVCRSCGEICTARAIRFVPRAGGVSRPELLAAACTGCGECLSACPAGAITIGRAPVAELS